MEIPKSFTTIITREDFATSEYLNVKECAFAKALNRKFPDNDIIVYGTFFTINNKRYSMSNSTKIIEGYGLPDQESLTVFCEKA